ncbi:hypothetical protein ACOME3_006995 [Neoechinorhynchus agilis]
MQRCRYCNDILSKAVKPTESEVDTNAMSPILNESRIPSCTLPPQSFDSTMSIVSSVCDMVDNVEEFLKNLSVDLTDVEFICQDCADTMADVLRDKLDEMQCDVKNYETFLEATENTSRISDFVQKVEKSTMTYPCDDANVETESNSHKSLNAPTEAELIKRNNLLRLKYEQNEEQLYLTKEMYYAKYRLDTLERTNVLNLAFEITHDEHFGVINGCRLGTLPGIDVPWPEINLGLGYVALLVNSLAREIKIPKFERYRIVPYVDLSYVETTTPIVQVYPLYNKHRKLVWTSKFDNALCGLLDCVNQIIDNINSKDSIFVFPYSIDKDTICDHSSKSSFSIRFFRFGLMSFNCYITRKIRYRGDKEEKWCKALKFLLIDLKWAITWTSGSDTRN